MFEIKGDLRNKKLAFTSRDLFKEDFLFNSKSRLSKKTLFHKHIVDSFNGKSSFEPILSVQRTALFSRQGNTTMFLSRKASS